MSCDNIAKIDIQCAVQNQAYSALFTFEDEDGAPYDLSLYPSIFFDVFSGTSRVDRLTLGNGLSASGDTLSLGIPQDKTAKYPPAGLTYELRLVNATGGNFYAAQGTLTLKPTKSR
jgi:hypothetical protein